MKVSLIGFSGDTVKVMEQFTDAVGLKRYSLFMQDYGAPVGMRLAMARPEAVTSMVFQNGNVYAEGLGKVWGQPQRLLG